MKRFISWLFSTRRGRFSLAFGAALTVAALYFTAEPRGALMAEIDYLRGYYGVCVAGPPSPWWKEERDLLRERYRVEVAGVIPDYITPLTLPLLWYGRGYDNVAEARLREKYGKDILAECERDAKARWLADHPKEAERMGIHP
jgi:hypothetical protein